MDLVVLVALAAGLFVILSLLFLLKQRSPKGEEAAPEPPARGQEGQRPRRAVVARNQRIRLRGGVQRQDESDEEAEKPKVEVEIPGNVGAKKRAKLEAKAERKAQHEAEVRAREDRKRRQEQEEEERQKTEELAKKEKERRLEEEKKAQEEKERREYEEYLKLKAEFNVEEEGFEEGNEDAEENLLQEFITYIKRMKVVVLEDLAVTFKMKTQTVIDRIQELQNEGTLTGVIDDRGKFIYISQEELAAVAKFVKQRGRVSIVDLAESSNQLINLNPSQGTVDVKS